MEDVDSTTGRFHTMKAQELFGQPDRSLGGNVGSDLPMESMEQRRLLSESGHITNNGGSVTFLIADWIWDGQF